MTNRIVPAVLDENSEFGKHVYAVVDKDDVISLVDSVGYDESDVGASPVAVLKATSIVDLNNPQVTPEIVESLKNFVVLRQGPDTLLTTKEQLETIISTL